jgi:ribose transport system substrate-binding protein
MNKTTLATLLLCGVVLFSGLGCSVTAEPSAEKDGKATETTGKKLQLAFVTNNASDFWTIARKGVEKADGELDNVEVNFQMPSEGTAAEQKRIVDDLLAKGVDGIAISPVDPKNQTEMLDGVAKQVLLVTQDSDAPDSQRACYVGTDNVAAGRQAGEELKKALPNGGKVMVFVGNADAQNAAERFKGLKEAIEGSKITILDIRTDGTERVKAKANVEDTLVNTPDIAGLVGLWSYNGPAILSAVKEAGKVGKVKIVCFDEEDDTLAGVAAGEIEVTIVQQPFEFGYQSVKLMSEVKGGKAEAIPADKKMIVETKAIGKDTVADFKKNLDELRGRK